MTDQTEMFPKTELDQAHQILSHLINEQEKAETAAENADKKLAEAQSRVYKQRQVISWLQAKMPATEPVVDGEASEADDEDEAEDAEVLPLERDVVDPITGEVTGVAERAAEVTVRVNHPDGITATREIGERTTYGQLAAEWATERQDDRDLGHFAVVGVKDGRLRLLRDVIAADDRGALLAVVDLDSDEDLAQCPTCRGDGRQPDNSGGGHHGICEQCGGFGAVARGDLDAAQEPAA